MKKKILLMTAIGLVLLGAVLAAALNAVFTVTDVVASFSVVSDEGSREALALQAELEEAFVGKSTTFLSLDDVRETVERYPAFRLEQSEKRFPRTLTLSVSERRETYAFRRENGAYAILDEDGVYLYDRESNVNRRMGENVLLEGFSLTADAAGAEASGAYFSEVLSFASSFVERFRDVRANLVSVSLRETPNAQAGEYFFRVRLREGVFVDVYNPTASPREKGMSVLEKYISLSDEQKLYGFFDVVDLFSGGFTVSEHRAEVPSGF